MSSSAASATQYATACAALRPRYGYLTLALLAFATGLALLLLGWRWHTGSLALAGAALLLPVYPLGRLGYQPVQLRLTDTALLVQPTRGHGAEQQIPLAQITHAYGPLTAYNRALNIRQQGRWLWWHFIPAWGEVAGNAPLQALANELRRCRDAPQAKE